MPPLAHDPNVAYFLLIIGVWLGVTATYVPGTGVIEIVSGLVMVGSLVMLADLPTNLGALLLLLVGVTTFGVVPFLKQRSWWLLAGGLALQAAGSILLFNGGIQVSFLLISVTLTLPLAYYVLVLLPMLRRHHNQGPVTDRDSDIVGMRGRVTQTLNPIGTVQVNNELWTAEARRKLEVGMPVIVTGRDGLKLSVELDKVKRDEFMTDEEEAEAEIEAASPSESIG